MAELNPKQRKFCEAYAQCLNATKAAGLAGYSPRTARQQGTRLLSNAAIKAEIARLLGQAAQRAELTLDTVLEELKKIMLADMRNYASWSETDVRMKSSDELTPEQTCVIESVQTTSGKDGTPQLRVRLHSKLRAAELVLRVFELSEIESRVTAIEEKLSRE